MGRVNTPHWGVLMRLKRTCQNVTKQRFWKEETGKMRKRKTVIYVALVVLIMAAGILMQYGIRWASGFFSGQIREKFTRPPEIMTESSVQTEEGLFALTLAGGTEADGSSALAGAGSVSGEKEIMVTPNQDVAVSEDSEIPESRSTLDGLTAYHNKNTPKVTGNASDIQAFVGDRNQNFVNAVLNFLYAYYRDQYLVEEIHLLEKVQEKDGVLDYRMELFLLQGKTKGQTIFMCSYDTKEDVYTIFNTRDATGKARLG